MTEERIRELTPREYWRLMGFTDEDFDKASNVCSETQLYAQAGNSICVPVLECIFREMFSPSKKAKRQPMLESFGGVQ